MDPLLFLYPFCGRAANHALGMVLTHQLSTHFKCQTAMSVNDYGIMIQCDQNIDLSSFNYHQFFSFKSISDLSFESFNHNEMILQEFRHICLISRLISKGLPGRFKLNRYTQSNVRILYDVFKEYDSDNLLLAQARDTVFNSQIFPKQLQDRLAVIAKNIIVTTLNKVSPFGYSLYQEQLSARMDGNGR